MSREVSNGVRPLPSHMRLKQCSDSLRRYFRLGARLGAHHSAVEREDQQELEAPTLRSSGHRLLVRMPNHAPRGCFADRGHSTAIAGFVRVGFTSQTYNEATQMDPTCT